MCKRTLTTEDEPWVIEHWEDRITHANGSYISRKRAQKTPKKSQKQSRSWERMFTGRRQHKSNSYEETRMAVRKAREPWSSEDKLLFWEDIPTGISNTNSQQTTNKDQDNSQIGQQIQKVVRMEESRSIAWSTHLHSLTSLSTSKEHMKLQRTHRKTNNIRRQKVHGTLTDSDGWQLRRDKNYKQKDKAELWSRETILQLDEIQSAIKRSWEEAGNTQVIARSLNSCKRKTEWNGHTLLSCRDDAFDWEVDRSAEESELLNWRDAENPWSPQKSCFVMEKRERKCSKYTEKLMLFHTQHGNFIHNSIMFIMYNSDCFVV